MLVFPNTEELLDLDSLQTSNHSEVGVYYTVYSNTLHKALNPDILEATTDGKIRAKERSSTSVTHKPFPTFRDTIMITTLFKRKLYKAKSKIGCRGTYARQIIVQPRRHIISNGINLFDLFNHFNWCVRRTIVHDFRYKYG